MLYMLLLCIGLASAQDPARLEQYNIDRSQISLSGFSSGAGFTTQFQVVHSSLIMGAAPFSGRPFDCNMDCNEDTPVADLVQDTEDFAARGDIDPTSNIGRARVFVLTGSEEAPSRVAIGRKIVEYYEHYGSNVSSEFELAVAHGFPTLDYGTECDSVWFPGINRCQYSGAFMALNHIYGGNLVNPGNSTAQPGQLLEFDQVEFRNSVSEEASFDPSGYVYVPVGCQNRATACKLHISFHGCFQGRDAYTLDFPNEYARHTGYNEVGELNNIIIMFPQIMPTDDNIGGCWDMYGIDGEDHQTKRGVHVRIIKAMLDRIAGL